jgi:hypothetical protein
MQLRVFSDVSASEGVRYMRMEPRARRSYCTRDLHRVIARSTVGPSMQLRVFSDVSASEGIRSCRMDEQLARRYYTRESPSCNSSKHRRSIHAAACVQ